MEQKLIARRTETHGTAKHLAREIGVDRPTYSGFERGKILPNRETLRRMCAAMCCGPLDLYEAESIDLAGCLKNRAEGRRGDRHKPCLRKTFRVPNEVITAIPDDFLETLGFGSWQGAFMGWLMACLEEYRKRKSPADAGTVNRARQNKMSPLV